MRGCEGNGKRHHCESYQQLGYDKVDSNGTRPVSLLTLETPAAHRTLFIHSEASAEKSSPAAIRATKQESTDQAGGYTHDYSCFVALIAAGEDFSAEADRKSTRLNSSHTVISY